MCRTSWKSGSLNLLEPSGPRRACYRTPLPLPLFSTDYSFLIHSVVQAHNPDAVQTQYLTHRYTIQLWYTRDPPPFSLYRHFTHDTLGHLSSQVSDCFHFLSSCIVLSVIPGYFQNTMDKSSRTFAVTVTHLEPSGTVSVSLRETFRMSRALRVAKLLGATAFCYNICVCVLYDHPF